MKKRIAIVTGASSGMGREMAREIGKQFRSINEIWLIARRKERLFALKEEIEKKNPRVSCVILAEDIKGEHFWENYKKHLEDSNGNVKLLVNGSGFGKIGTCLDISEKDSVDMVRLNCEALTGITRITVPYMAKDSRIINFASMAAFIPQAGFSIYAATKAYVYSYTMALAEELKGKDIYCTAVCPGPVATEFFDVAEDNGNRPWYKNFFMADCNRVVKKALCDSIHRRKLSIYGISMKGLYVLTKLAPVEVFTKITGILNRGTGK